jgi:hypothetical protein
MALRVADLEDLRNAGVTRIELGCGMCERRGHYGIQRLIEHYGPSIRMTELKDMIAEDCPRQKAASIYDRCGVLYLNAGSWRHLTAKPPDKPAGQGSSAAVSRVPTKS